MTKRSSLLAAAKILPVLGAIGFLASGTAEAYRVLGAGTTKCPAWTKDRKAPQSVDALQDANWVLGFLSGIGHKATDGDDPLKGLESQTVLTWIDTFCGAHDAADLDDAARAFYNYHPH